MKLSSGCAIAALALLESAAVCANAQVPVQRPASSAVRAADSKMAARSELLRSIHQGMGFVTFRRVVLAQGWKPIPHTPPCLGQVDEKLCVRLPEVWDTSSVPIEYNSMSYRHGPGGERINVTVTGDISSWGRSDAEAELRLDSWGFGETTDDR